MPRLSLSPRSRVSLSSIGPLWTGPVMDIHNMIYNMIQICFPFRFELKNLDIRNYTNEK